MKTGKDQAALLSPHMEQVAKALATAQGMNWAQTGAQLTLAMSGRNERWLLLNLDGERFSLTCCLVEPDETLIPEIDMVFAMHSDGWEPIELLYSHEAFASFVQAAQAAGLPIYDPEGNLRFDTFTEYWARQLVEQGWLTHSRWLSEPETDSRLIGCQSTNHTACYGDLWQCAGCGKTVCYAEGTDNQRELCDDCWVMVQPGRDEIARQRRNVLKQQPLQLLCDCPAQCGTWLALTDDGFLVLEDKDGLRISILLPDWLDYVIRHALLTQTAADARAAADQPLDWLFGCLEDEIPF